MVRSLAWLLFLALLSGCGAGAPPAPAGGGGGETDTGPEEPAPPAKAPAVAAFEALAAVGEDASFEERACRLSLAFKEHLYLRSLVDRARILKQAGLDGWEEVLARANELRARRDLAGSVGLDAVEEAAEEAASEAEARFGADPGTLAGFSDAEAFRRWLPARWNEEVKPDTASLFLESTRAVEDRRYAFLSGGRGGRRQVLLFTEAPVPGRLLYGGTEEQRRRYMVGPMRRFLFDLSTAEERRSAAKVELEEIVTSLMAFRQDTSRYPSGAEGLEALLEEPRGTGVVNWNGPYKARLFDPWGRRYRYRHPGQRNEGFVDVWSVGPDGKSGTADDIVNWE